MKASAMTTENATNEIFIVLSKKEWYHRYFKGLVFSATRRVNHDSIDHKLTRILMQPKAKIIESLFSCKRG